MTGSDPIRTLALRLFDTLGRDLLGESLTARGWSFGYDRARKRLGACHLRQRRITLSAHLSRSLSDAEIEDTLRHEIAHAIDFERRGVSRHDATWKRIAIACGASPERCFDGDLPDDPSAPYVGTCPTCGERHDLYRQPVHPRRCRACARGGEPAFVRVVHQASGAVIWPGGETAGAYGGTAGVAATCSTCGESVRRARRPTRALACARCCREHAGGRFDSRFRLRFR